MKKFLIKTIVVVIIGSLAGGIGFYFWKGKYGFQNLNLVVEDKAAAASKGDLLEVEEARKLAEKKKNESNEARVISYIEQNIDRIANKQSGSSTDWEAVKIWFLDNNNFYVDYRDSAVNMRRILVNQIPEGKSASYEVLGYFVPGSTGWVLQSGTDIENMVPVKVYEKNGETNEWQVK